MSCVGDTDSTESAITTTDTLKSQTQSTRVQTSLSIQTSGQETQTYFPQHTEHRDKNEGASNDWMYNAPHIHDWNRVHNTGRPNLEGESA